MLKPQQLRAELTSCLQWLQRNPGNLQVRVERGRDSASTLATSLSHEYRYTLNLLFLDYTGDLDLIVVPMQAWLRENQPDIMATEEKRRTGLPLKRILITTVLMISACHCS